MEERKIMKYIIDRFEEGNAVCEQEDRTMLLISRSQLPSDAKEGDVILYTDGVYQVDKEATLERKKKIEEKIERDFSRDDFSLVIVADWLGIPDKKLYRDFKKMFGVSFSSYLEIRRIRCAQEYLKEGRAVQDVAAAVGYSSDYSFRRAFKRVVGVAPSDYQKRF